MVPTHNYVREGPAATVTGRKGNRSRRWELRAAVILVWVAATLAGLAVAATSRIGSILFAVSADHGVHVGDLLAFAVFYVAAIVLTVVLLQGVTRRVRRRVLPIDDRPGPPDGCMGPPPVGTCPRCSNESHPPAESPIGAPQPPA